MRPLCQPLAPRDRNHQAAPLRPWGGGENGPGGDSGEPPSPPPLPPLSPPLPGGRKPANSDGGPAPPRGGRPTEGRDATDAASAAARQAPPVDRLLTPALPAAGWRLCAGAVGRNGTTAPGNAQTKRPAFVPAWGRQGSRQWRGDLPPPPATLTLRRPTGPRPAATTVRQPVYTQGGCAGEEGGQGRGPRAAAQGREEGNSGAPPPSPHPPTPPVACGPRGRQLSTPPRPRGRPPSRRRGRDARLGAQLDRHAARPRATQCLPPRGSRQAGEPAPARKNGTRATPEAAHDNEPEQYGGPA